MRVFQSVFCPPLQYWAVSGTVRLSEASRFYSPLKQPPQVQGSRLVGQPRNVRCFPQWVGVKHSFTCTGNLRSLSWKFPSSSISITFALLCFFSPPLSLAQGGRRGQDMHLEVLPFSVPRSPDFSRLCVSQFFFSTAKARSQRRSSQSTQTQLLVSQASHLSFVLLLHILRACFAYS